MPSAHRTRLGQMIRQIRHAKGWSQEELASRAGLHSTYIGGIERGERNVGFDNLIKIAIALGKHPATLFANFPKTINLDRSRKS